MNSFVMPLLASVAFGWCYFRLLRGTGIPAGSLLGAAAAGFVLLYPAAGKILTGILIAAAVVVEVDFQRRRKAYQASEMIFEGGGIRRGLTPAAVGALFDLPVENLLPVGLLELLQKGLIATNSDHGRLSFQPAELIRVDREIINPAEKMKIRKAAARVASLVLTSTEDILIELISQQGDQPVSAKSAQVWAYQLAQQTESDMGGFDREKTKVYYDAFITHRLNGVAAGHFKADEYTGWMALARALGMLDSAALMAVVRQSRPAWLGDAQDLLAWLDLVSKSISQ